MTSTVHPLGNTSFEFYGLAFYHDSGDDILNTVKFYTGEKPFYATKNDTGSNPDYGARW